MVMIDEWHLMIVDLGCGFLPIPTSRELSWGKRGYDEIWSARVSCLFTQGFNLHVLQLHLRP